MKEPITKQLTILITLGLAFLVGNATAQTTDYEKAIAQFTGEHKYDIERPGALDGVEAPDFGGVTLDGKQVCLSGFRNKKVVVLNFWFIACAPCRMEVAPLNDVVTKFKEKDVVFLSVAREKEDDLRKHLQNTPFAFQTIADPSLKISKDTYHLFGYPTTVVIDKQGKIRYYTLGGKINEEAVRKELDTKLVPVILQLLKAK